MGIELLDKDLVISKDSKTGIISYSHPDCSTVITSDYKVYNAKNGRPLKVYQNEKLVGGQISSRFKGKRANFSFGRLLALMAGHGENGYYRLIDESKPLSLENVTSLQDYMSSSNGNKASNTTKRSYVRKPKNQPEPKIFAIPSQGDNNDLAADIIIPKEKIKEYFLDYVPCEDNVRFQTEDGLIFEDRAKALMHQLSVDKGKEAAMKVVNANAGYELAEEMYMMHVHYYAGGKPRNYNFREILDNDSGVIELGDKTYLVEADGKKTAEFSDKTELEHWLKAQALVTMVMDMKSDVSKIAELIK